MPEIRRLTSREADRLIAARKKAREDYRANPTVCPYCGDGLLSPGHGPESYSHGFFVLGEGDQFGIVVVEGEEEILRLLRDPDFPAFQVFWTEDALESHLVSRLPPSEDES